MTIDRDNLLSVLSRENRYLTPQETYSPFCSNIGLIVDEHSRGVDAIWLHYNRYNRTLWEKLIDLPYSYNPTKSDVTKLVFGENEAELSFYDADCFLLETEGTGEILLFSQPSERLTDCWVRCADDATVLLQGYSANGDARDPDETVCFMAGIRATNGSLHVSDTGVTAVGDDKSRMRLAFAFALQELSEESL